MQHFMKKLEKPAQQAAARQPRRSGENGATMCNGQSETSRSLESVCQLDKCQLSAVPVVEGTENINLITISRAQLHGNQHGIRIHRIS